jgi:hypothetical protein
MSAYAAENQRFKDVLFALAAASEFHESLGRLRLQKFIYLADVLAVAWRRVAKPAGFSPYRNGPYDSRIQNAVDALAFRGLVNVSRLTFRGTKNAESCYGLSPSGQSVVESIANAEEFGDDLQLFREIAREVNRRGWEHIKALVYAEPTYDAARASNYSQRLRTDSQEGNLSLRILREFELAFSQEQNTPLSRRNFVQLFFSLLERHAGLKTERREAN